MPKVNLTVCVLVLNEEKKLRKCLNSVKGWAKEIIVGVDKNSFDKSEKIARELADRVIVLDHQKNFHLNKQKVVDMAKQPWILWLDGDEKVTPELRDEIGKELANPGDNNGYQMPRKNIIFNTWMEHTGWYPDYQIRLFRKSKGKFPCKKIHEDIKIEGGAKPLNSDLVHYNYESVSQFINKLNRYTSLDAKHLNVELKNQHLLKPLITRPINELMKRFMSLEGYKDGFHGLVLSLLQAFYELVVVVKVWEMRKFEDQEMGDIKDIEELVKQGSKDWRWWKRETKIKSSKSVKKIKHRVLRKLGR